MKLRLALNESNEASAADQDLIDLITSAKASGVDNIATRRVTSELQALGHGFTDSLVAARLNQTNLVAQADEQMIHFVMPEAPPAKSDEESSENKVSNMATQSAMKNLRSKD